MTNYGNYVPNIVKNNHCFARNRSKKSHSSITHIPVHDLDIFLMTTGWPKTKKNFISEKVYLPSAQVNLYFIWDINIKKQNRYVFPPLSEETNPRTIFFIINNWSKRNKTQTDRLLHFFFGHSLPFYFPVFSLIFYPQWTLCYLHFVEAKRLLYIVYYIL